MTDSVQLLRSYAERGDEAAFRELVERFVDLVYSAALRRVGGDAELARDVTQTVFSDLARKARGLGDVEMLGGWLHRHTGFVAATVVRSERARQAREQKAAEMNTLHEAPDPLWQQLAPVLDETIDVLEAADRRAILLRFFERRDFRSVGAALGISDDAAQKRVSRALEKLRGLLTQRGVTFSVVLLGHLLAARVIQAAPAGLAASVSSVALASAAAGIGLVGLLVKWATSTGFKVGLGIAAVVTAACLVLLRHPTPGDQTVGRNEASSSQQGAIIQPAVAVENLNATHGSDGSLNNTSNKLVLHLVAADTGEPIPMVTIDSSLLEVTNSSHEQYVATRSGECVVPVPRGTARRLLLWTQTEGFADTWLHWRLDRGDAIPAEYTLKLTRAVRIGGRVLDADAQPVAGAHVGFGIAMDPGLEAARPEAHAVTGFGALTDEQGRWTLNRIAPEVLPRLGGAATHADHTRSPQVSIVGDPEAEKQLLAGTYVFQLGRAVTLRGSVLDPDNQPVPRASLRASAVLGRRSFGASGFTGTGEIRWTTNQVDGSFVLPGCAPGENRISVEAKGFISTNLVVTLAANSTPLRLTLQPGRLLRLRVVDQKGQPVTRAVVDLQAGANRILLETDADGRLEWDSAFDFELTAEIRAVGYLRSAEIPVRADGQEQVVSVSLASALTLSGIVRDAESGQPIRNFRIIPGWTQQRFNVTNIQWQSLGQIPWISSEDGSFRQAIKEATTAERSLVFKFEADGHAPFVTREVRSDEGEVQFDIALRAAAPTTITVLLPDGRPAAHAEVGLVSPGAPLLLIPGGFSRSAMPNGSEHLLTTDDAGRFALPPDDAVARVIAATADGYLEATPAALAAEPTMRLQPWGRIEGVFLSGGRVAPGRVVQFQYGSNTFTMVSSYFGAYMGTPDLSAYRVTTDQDGRFVFPKVPPGKHRLAQVVLADRAGFGSARGPGPGNASPLADVEIRAGETTTVNLGAAGYTVTARLLWPVDVKRESGWHVQVSLRTPPPSPPADTQSDPRALSAWRARPEIAAGFAATRRSRPLVENSDGTFVAEDVPSGNYELNVNVFEAPDPAANRPQAQVHARARVPLTVPADPATGTLDLGEVELKANPAAAARP